MDTLLTALATYRPETLCLSLRNSCVIMFLIMGATMISIAAFLLWTAPEPPWLALWGKGNALKTDRDDEI